MTFACPSMPKPQDPTGVFVILGFCLFMFALIALMALASRLGRYVGEREMRRKGNRQ